MWQFNPQVKPGVDGKFAKHWNGPYEIVERLNDVTYELQSFQLDLKLKLPIMIDLNYM